MSTAEPADPADPGLGTDEAPLDELTQAYVDLVERLAGFGASDPETLDGFLTGVAAAPDPRSIDDWLTEAIGADTFERCCADPEDAARARDVLARYQARIAAALDPQALEDGDGPALWPYMHDFDAEHVERARAAGASDDELRVLQAGAPWAMGVLHGLQWCGLFEDPRVRGDAAQQISECVAALIALSLDPASADWRSYVDQHWRGRKPDRDTLIDDAIGAVEALRLGWLDAALTPLPRVSDKVGRNDPCPCGSGKKFKKCHGAAGAHA